MKYLSLVLLLLAACNRGEAAKTGRDVAPPAASASRGPALAAQYGCNVCHIIPGVDGPQGSLGPSLQGLASRPMISEGTVQNTPDNLVKFIQNPAALNPQSSMPPMAMPETDAQELAAFLRTLK
jgi:cytochrome c